MPEPVVRLLVVVGAVGLAALAVGAAGWRRRRRAESEPLDLGAVAGRLILLSDASCRRCDRVREMLVEAGVEFAEVAFGDELWEGIGAGSVPQLIARDEFGGIAGRVGGVPTRRRFAALLRRAT